MKETVASPLPIRVEANVFWGLIFLLAGSISFLGFFCVAIMLKLLPPSGNQFISAIQNDRYPNFKLHGQALCFFHGADSKIIKIVKHHFFICAIIFTIAFLGYFVVSLLQLSPEIPSFRSHTAPHKMGIISRIAGFETVELP